MTLSPLEQILSAMQKNKASDLHLKVGSPPLMRIRKKLVRTKLDPMTRPDIESWMYGIMTENNKKELIEFGAADFSHSVDGVGRFRVNVFFQRGTMSASIRRVEVEIPTLEQLNLPVALSKITEIEQGLVIVAGITGCGKSTTLASLLNMINKERYCHIVTIENPIEYLYHDERAIVNQREIGIDVPDYKEALRYVLRQDPDVILIGEMRDAETFDTALMAAETGHLVFGTIHVSTAAGAVGRILDYYPIDKHHQIRQMLFFNLRAVIVQKLVPSERPETQVVPAVEIMYVNPSIKKLIHEGEDNKIIDVIRGSVREGMQDFSQSLMQLYKSKWISLQSALDNSPNPDQMKMQLKGISHGEQKGVLLGG